MCTYNKPPILCHKAKQISLHLLPRYHISPGAIHDYSPLIPAQDVTTSDSSFPGTEGEIFDERKHQSRGDFSLKQKQNLTYFNPSVHCKSKGKAIPLQAWTGPEGSKRLTLFPRQSAHEGGKVVSSTHRQPLPPRKYSW